MLRKKKLISLTVITMILVTAFSLIAHGTSITKTLQAWYGTIKIIINDEDVTERLEPFIADGTTYIPLRVVAEIFNKNVHWDELTSTATITDDLTKIDGYYQTEILKRDVEILTLQTRVRKLEKELEKAKKIDLDDVEEKLNDEFDEYRGIEFDIILSGDTDDVEVRIDVDLYDYESKWNSLSTSRKTSYLQNIVDEILEAYPDASVEGYVRDSDAKKTILEFTTTKKGKVDIEYEYGYMDIDELAEDLDDYYYNYFKGIDLYIDLEGDEDDIVFYIELDYDEFGEEWDDLSDTSIRRLMSKIYDDIENELWDAYITGYVYDFYYREDLAEYYRTSSGSERFIRY